MYAALYLRNFKCFDTSYVSFRSRRGEILQQIHLIGDNVTGKTSFLSAFAFLKVISEDLSNFKVLENERFKDHVKLHQPKVICDRVKHCSRHGAKDGMSLGFEIVIKKTKYFYELDFDCEHQLIRESLYRVVGSTNHVVIQRDQDSFSYGKGIIKKKYDPIMNELFEIYGKDHTLLSIIQYAYSMKLIEIKDSLELILDFIFLHNINVGQHKHDDYFNFGSEFYSTHVYGIQCNHYIKLLEASTFTMLQYLKSLFPKIHNVRYQVTPVGDNKFEYQLVIAETREHGFAELLPHEWSSSYIMALDFSSILLDSHLGCPVVFDDFGGNAHYQTKLTLIESLTANQQSQVFFTTTTTSYMNDVNQQYFYSVRYTPERGHFIENLVQAYNIRSEHNIQQRYEKGFYGQERVDFKPNYEQHHSWFLSLMDKFYMLNNRE